MKSLQKKARFPQRLPKRLLTCFFKLMRSMDGQEWLWRSLHPTWSQWWMVMIEDIVYTESFLIGHFLTAMKHWYVIRYCLSEHGKTNKQTQNNSIRG